MDACRWEYRVVVLKIPNVYRMEGLLNDYGIGGWEVVTLSTTVKTMINTTGNDLIAVLKRPSVEPADREHGGPTAGWYPDPVGHHELREWDGSEWTERVKDARREGVDPLPSSSGSS